MTLALTTTNFVFKIFTGILYLASLIEINFQLHKYIATQSYESYEHFMLNYIDSEQLLELLSSKEDELKFCYL